jgi:hypothetical protein
LTDEGFELISVDSSKGFKHENFSVPELASKQEQHIVEIVKKLRARLERKREGAAQPRQ